MKATSFKIFITKSSIAAAVLAKGLLEEPIKGGNKITVEHGCVSPDSEFIQKMYEGLYYAYIEYTTEDGTNKYELILC